MARISFTVNGVARSADVDSETPLLWVLRDNLGLTGTKFGCGLGMCGACTVHLGGGAVRSCQTPVGSVAGMAVTTIEGLAPRGDHPCQRAWIEEDVPQCGYCQVGMIMTASSLIAQSPPVTAGEVEAALSEHLCRCGTYVRVRRAVKRALELAREGGRS